MDDLLDELNKDAELEDIIYQEWGYLESISFDNEVQEKIRLSNIELCKRFLDYDDYLKNKLK
jgi:hypothetical protein